MKRIIRRLSLIFAGIITAAAVMSLCACSSDDVHKTYIVYYTNADIDNNVADDIVYTEWKVDGAEDMDAYELTQALVDRLFNADLSETKVFSAKPKDVIINEFTIEDGIVTFDFNSEYLNMTNVQEILLRSALVLTVIQEPEISGVQFTVEHDALKDSAGKRIGVMNADNFADVLLNGEGMLTQETDLTIFFTDETGTKLIPAKYHFTIKNSNTSMEEYILQQLKTGPAIDTTFRTMGPDVEIIGVMTTDGVCYVNFSEGFLEQEQPVGDEILIYSIVNSLCDLPYVNSVQFLINGTSDNVLHTVTDLSQPFTPNTELEMK